MLLARTEAHDEVEAAEQRSAAALALERAELSKQVQLTLNVRECSTARAPPLRCDWFTRNVDSAAGARDGCTRRADAAAWSTWKGAYLQRRQARAGKACRAMLTERLCLGAPSAH